MKPRRKIKMEETPVRKTLKKVFGGKKVNFPKQNFLNLAKRGK